MAAPTGRLKLARSLIATEPRLRVVELRRNFGQTAALQAGLAAARGDIVVSMDSDLQHFPGGPPAASSNRSRRATTWSAAGGTIGRRACSGAGRRSAANWLIRAMSGLCDPRRRHDLPAYRGDLVQRAPAARRAAPVRAGARQHWSARASPRSRSATSSGRRGNRTTASAGRSTCSSTSCTCTSPATTSRGRSRRSARSGCC